MYTFRTAPVIAITVTVQVYLHTHSDLHILLTLRNYTPHMSWSLRLNIWFKALYHQLNTEKQCNPLKMRPLFSNCSLHCLTLKSFFYSTVQNIPLQSDFRAVMN